MKKKLQDFGVWVEVNEKEGKYIVSAELELLSKRFSSEKKAKKFAKKVKKSIKCKF